MAAGTIYQLIQKEQGIVCAALLFDPEDEEKKFNETVNAAIDNFAVFSTNKWANPSSMAIQLFTNLSEFFDHVIDVKKAESLATDTAASVDVSAVPVATGSAEEPIAKKNKSQRK